MLSSCSFLDIKSTHSTYVFLSLLSLCAQTERIRGIQSRFERCRALAGGTDPKAAESAIPLLSAMVKADVCRAVEPYVLLIEAYLLTSRADKADEASKYVTDCVLFRTSVLIWLR